MFQRLSSPILWVDIIAGLLVLNYDIENHPAKRPRLYTGEEEHIFLNRFPLFPCVPASRLPYLPFPSSRDEKLVTATPLDSALTNRDACKSFRICSYVNNGVALRICLSAELIAGLTEFESAVPINDFLSRLLLLQAQERIPPRRAAVMASSFRNEDLLRKSTPSPEALRQSRLRRPGARFTPA